jgi:hypothetical protein
MFLSSSNHIAADTKAFQSLTTRNYAIHIMTQLSTLDLPALPRELIDAILSELIPLCNDDPAYQWTCVRHLTRYHRAQVEQHFRKFWIPKSTLTYTDYIPGLYFTVSEQDASNSKNGGQGGDTDTARFAAQYRKEVYSWNVVEDWDSDYEEGPDGNEEPPPQPSAVITLGEGFLNKGYTKGGIMTHIPVISGYRYEQHPEEICLHWKPVFTQLLCEEMLMRRFRDRLLTTFLSGLESEPSRHDTLHHFLWGHYQNQAREMVDAYRDRAPDQSFDMTPFLSLPMSEHYTALQNIFHREETMVFQIPGWQAFEVREVARLRISEELITEDMIRSINWGYAGEKYLEEIKRREAQMLGKEEISDEGLGELLRGDALDVERLTEW